MFAKEKTLDESTRTITYWLSSKRQNLYRIHLPPFYFVSLCVHSAPELTMVLCFTSLANSYWLCAKTNLVQQLDRKRSSEEFDLVDEYVTQQRDISNDENEQYQQWFTDEEDHGQEEDQHHAYCRRAHSSGDVYEEKVRLNEESLRIIRVVRLRNSPDDLQ